MTQVSVTVITGTEQVRGRIETNSWPLDGSRPDILVQLDNGQQQMVPITALNRQEDGSYMAHMPADEHTCQPEMNQGEQGQSVVVPIMAEEVAIYKRELERGRVRITKTVHEREKFIDEPLFREDVLIERIAINRIVEAPIPLRYEGDTMIISLVEEVPVIEKRLMLKEELRITRQSVVVHKPISVLLRSEEASVEHITFSETENSEIREGGTI